MLTIFEVTRSTESLPKECFDQGITRWSAHARAYSVTVCGSSAAAATIGPAALEYIAKQLCIRSNTGAVESGMIKQKKSLELRNEICSCACARYT